MPYPTYEPVRTVIYYRHNNSIFFYVPSQFQSLILEDPKQWIESQGFTILQMLPNLAKNKPLILCEVEYSPSSMHGEWQPRMAVVHGLYSDELSTLVQIAYDKVTGVVP